MKKIRAIAVAMALFFLMPLISFAEFECGAITEVNGVKFDIPKSTAATVLDGKVSPGEFYKLEFNDDMLSWGGSDIDPVNELAKKAGQLWEIYVGWSDTYVSYAVVYKPVTPPVNPHTMSDENLADMWSRTCLGWGITAYIDGHDPAIMNDGIIARNSETGEEVGIMYNHDAAAAEEYVLKPGKNFSCDLTDEGYLVYEQIIPFTAFSPEDLKEGDVFGFSVNHEMGFEDPAAFTDVQLAAGVGFGRNTERLARMTMVAAPHIDASAEQEEVSDPEPEAPESVAQNPQTSDDNLFIYAALCSLLVIAVSWAFMQKKSNSKK